MTTTIRDATAADAGAIAAIYNHAVEHTTAIWNDGKVDAANRAGWIAERQAQGHAVIVAEAGGIVAGYAAFGPFRPQDGFRDTVEHSVYVAPSAQGKGIGRALLAAIVDRARAQGRRAVIGCIDATNSASLALHRALGFRDMGLLPGVGQKFGRQLDLALLQLTLVQPDPGGLRVGIMGGTGWLGRALGQNLLARGIVAPADLAILNRRGPTADYDRWPGVRWATDAADLAATCDVLVLSVRPEDYDPAACHPGPAGFGGLVLSFVAGLTLAELARDWPRARAARAMPGGGASTGTAHVPWCGPETLPRADATLVERLLGAIGTVDRVADERALAVLTALSGSGVAYPALMAGALRDHALAQGIAPDVAWNAVRSVICDSPALLLPGPDTIAAMIDTYLGYRGITAAGLIAAKDAGFARALDAALTAATAHALAMDKG